MKLLHAGRKTLVLTFERGSISRACWDNHSGDNHSGDECYMQPLPGETETPLEPKYRVTKLGRRLEPSAEAGTGAALEQAAAAARLFGQVELAVAGTSRQCVVENGPEPGEQPT